MPSSARFQSLTGHLACFGAYAIFGLNIIFCKDIANEGILPPLVLFAIRASVATAVFWMLSLFFKRQSVPWSDLLRLCGASLLGLVVPQLTFLYAIGMTTPIDLSVVQSCTPVMTMFVAAIFLREPITWKKVAGVALSLAGVLWLIFQSVHTGNVAHTRPLGFVLTILNSLSFAFYLGICRPVIHRYNVVTVMKWMFLFATLVSLPFASRQMENVNYGAVTPQVWLEVGYLVIFATVVAYFLIPLGQQRIRPTLVSMYGYLQPVIAAIVSIAVGMDRLSVTKVFAALCVFAGVAIVNRSRAAAPPSPHPPSKVQQ